MPYFLVTFTVPEQLRFVFAARPELVHDLFFAAVSAALQEVVGQSGHRG